MSRISLKTIQNKKNKEKITCLTAYTSSIAKIIDKYVDVILVGDSLGNIIYGMKNTQSVTLEMMMYHGKAVCKSSNKALTIIDMPYQSYNTKRKALINALKLLNYTKCQSVKIETDESNVEIVKHLSENGIKVVSHIGVTPQKYKNFNNIKSVGNNYNESEKLFKLALKLEKAGSKLIVLECIKEHLAKKITRALKIPTIGIGASKHCDGQILVTNDMLEIVKFEKKPKFIKTFASLHKIIDKAVSNYCKEVINKKFPSKTNSY